MKRERERYAAHSAKVKKCPDVKLSLLASSPRSWRVLSVLSLRAPSVMSRTRMARAVEVVTMEL